MAETNQKFLLLGGVLLSASHERFSAILVKGRVSEIRVPSQSVDVSPEF
jgi:hypothetical protein